MAERKPSLRKKRIVPLEFFKRPAARMARDLVGKRVVRSLGSATLSFTITETEAYEGEHDLASHSAKGRTDRTEVMFGIAGRFYIYRIYGLHWMLNIVTGEVNEAAAVLVRGVEGVNGPGRVAAALSINSALTGLEAVPASGLWFEEPLEARHFRVARTARVGVDCAGPIWAAKKLRFVMA